MQFQHEMEINVPRERVIELFLDPDSLAKWQPGFLRFEHISGKEREVGAKARQVYKQGNRESEFIETITVRNYPEEFSATYEAGSVWNLIENYFTEIDDNRTKWVLKSDFRSTNFFMKLFAFLMPGMIKNQSFDWMNKFREFVEKSSS